MQKQSTLRSAKLKWLDQPHRSLHAFKFPGNRETCRGNESRFLHRSDPVHNREIFGSGVERITNLNYDVLERAALVRDETGILQEEV